MYTGRQTQNWAAMRTHGAAAVQRAEAGLPWEQESSRHSADQEIWLVSFIDMLMLLLTLFVLLLAYQKDTADQEGDAADTVPAQQVRPAMHVVAETEQTSTATQARLADAVVIPDATTAVHDDPVVSDLLSVSTTVGAPLRETPPVLTTPARHYLEMLADSSTKPNIATFEQIAAAATADAGTSAPPADPVAALLADLADSTLQDRIEVTVQPGGVNLEISDSILFLPASAALTMGGMQLLDELAATLRAHPYALSVEGHTDNVPIETARFPSNWELASARATLVTRHLIQQGLAPERVRAIGYADTRPRADNQTADGRARNRRVSFVLRMP